MNPLGAVDVYNIFDQAPEDALFPACRAALESMIHREVREVVEPIILPDLRPDGIR